jgi:hypothetical protein
MVYRVISLSYELYTLRMKSGVPAARVLTRQSTPSSTWLAERAAAAFMGNSSTPYNGFRS